MRKILIQIHLILAAFAAPAFILVATSGGLYLIGVKGELLSTEISLPVDALLDFSSPTLDADVRGLLAEVGVQHEFEYLKDRGSLIQTRPTSRSYLEFTLDDGVLSLSRKDPSLQSSMIELHKGHGPLAFKTYQKGVAISLLLVVLSGLWMGLTSRALRTRTTVVSVAGLILFLVLAL